MNFAAFQTYRAAQLAANPTLVDLAETNLWRSLDNLVPKLSADAGPHVHRCHLAQAWFATFCLPDSWAGRALVSVGVRHRLSLIFPILAQQRVTLRMPEDVYPVYGQLARTAGVDFQTFPTLLDLKLPSNGDWLLLSNPLKPAGRWLTTNEVTAIREWLANDTGRRLLLDAVYTFDTCLHPTANTLLQTGQTILLHSLPKGWLHPQVFGIALVSESDIGRFNATFRDNPPSQINLFKAKQLLADHVSCPNQVANRLASRRARLLTLLPEQVRSSIILRDDAEPAGYLITVHANSRHLFEQHHLLAIPISVFGSSRDDCSVRSTLAVDGMNS